MSKPNKSVPEVLAVRPDEDVRRLLEIALQSGQSGCRNINRIGNECLRQILTPRFGTKRIWNLQEKNGVSLNQQPKSA